MQTAEYFQSDSQKRACTEATKKNDEESLLTNIKNTRTAF